MSSDRSDAIALAFDVYLVVLEGKGGDFMVNLPGIQKIFWECHATSKLKLCEVILRMMERQIQGEQPNG